ncbi:MAG: DsbA family protein [Bacteroidetes bacterium]|nr:DsbA family protein [Bacteroidota bacterium]
METHLKKSPVNLEQEQILSIAQEIDLDIYQFSSDMQDSTIYEEIIQNFKHINDLGFYGTPTIVINNRKMFDAFSETEIENAIVRELSK